MSPRATPIELGKYVIGDVIASGGMATVHLGRISGARGFVRAVAIKRLHAQFARDPELREALEIEARLAARIRHPNVVSVLDVVEQRDELLLVMDFVPGVALSMLVRRAREHGRRVPPMVAVTIASAILRGLHAAHELRDESGEPLGVVHRDVSPQNVLVSADGVARLVDFGIAKLKSSATRGTSLRGKPGYMAPEQLRDEPVDRRTDVWGASVVLWELLTGARLFGGDSDHAVMLKILERRIDSPDRIVPDLPPELAAATLRGLCRDKPGRFASALEMAEALEKSARPATNAEVGAFVSALCGAELGALERKLVDFENQSQPRRAPRARRIALAIAGVVLVSAGIAALAAYRSTAQPPSAPASAEAALETAPAPIATHAARAAPPAERAAPTLATSAPSARRLPARPARSASAPDCDPPYVIDSEGFQRMKRECL